MTLVLMLLVSGENVCLRKTIEKFSQNVLKTRSGTEQSPDQIASTPIFFLIIEQNMILYL